MQQEPHPVLSCRGRWAASRRAPCPADNRRYRRREDSHPPMTIDGSGVAGRGSGKEELQSHLFLKMVCLTTRTI